MKKVVVFLFVIGILLTLILNPFKVAAFDGFSNLLYHTPCAEPIRYSIGTIDERFEITEQQLVSDLAKAEEGWESTTGRNLFAYDPSATLKVNLVYDRRQDLSNQIYDLKDQIEQDKNSLKPEIEEYERRSQAFRQRLSNLNQEIEKFNSQGGAPEGDYDRLIKEQQSLQQEANELNEMARRLNRTSDEFANKVGELNQTVNRFNSALSVRPEEGLYDPNNNIINIYFHTDPTEFVHTLAHELGHARGMGHTEDPSAIMYTQTNKVVIPTSSDVALLEKVCQRKSYGQLVIERIQFLYEYYTNRNKAINRGESS